MGARDVKSAIPSSLHSLKEVQGMISRGDRFCQLRCPRLDAATMRSEDQGCPCITAQDLVIHACHFVVGKMLEVSVLVAHPDSPSPIAVHVRSMVQLTCSVLR